MKKLKGRYRDEEIYYHFFSVTYGWGSGLWKYKRRKTTTLNNQATETELKNPNMLF